MEIIQENGLFTIGDEENNAQLIVSEAEKTRYARILDLKTQEGSKDYKREVHTREGESLRNSRWSRENR